MKTPPRFRFVTRHAVLAGAACGCAVGALLFGLVGTWFDVFSDATDGVVFGLVFLTTIGGGALVGALWFGVTTRRGLRRFDRQGLR